jgi:NADH-quinone oxidoreductase subunit M
MVGALVFAVVASSGWSMEVRALAESEPVRRRASVLAPLLLVASTARMGIFPFHVWVPVALSRGRLSVTLPSVVSPLGSFAVVRLALGLFPAETRVWCGLLMAMATASSLYGAVLALGQHHARRQLGYLWMSVAGFVLAGIATLDVQGLSGALIHDLALTVATTGLALIVRAVEARTGTADFRRLGGLVLHAPRMATGYFLLGAAAVGFPATVTFVSEDLVVQGLVRTRPIVAVLLLTAMAINGVTLVRSFKRIFLGPTSRLQLEPQSIPDLLPRERWISVVLVAALLAGGFVPTPLLAIRRQVESGLLAPRP